MQTMMRTILLILAFVPWDTESALAQAYPSPGSDPPPASSPPLASAPPSQSGQYSSNEVLDAGHRFFGTISRGLGEIVEKAGSQWGLPNGYVLGQEASGAWVAGLRYREGTLFTKNAGDEPKAYNVRLGALRQRNELVPRRQIFVRSQQTWVNHVNSIPKFEGMPPR
jgi:hypothetical protein